MGYDCVVCIKYVPDTQRVTGEAMKEDGTVNRAALPMVFNPEDLNALEQALAIRDARGGSVAVVTMGAPAAGEILRESLCRGADRAVLLTDRRAAASDTLATSYILSCAVKKLPHDLVLCGRQAIDGDTAQVGPQMAEKLGIPQITYVEELLGLDAATIRVRRSVGNGFEVIDGDLPILLTVMDTANTPRPPAAKRIMKYKKARAPAEVAREAAEALGPDADPDAVTAEAEKRCDALRGRGLLIDQWSLDDIDADLTWCGARGSPTKVHRIQSVILAGGQYREHPPTDEGVRELVAELIEDHTIG